MAFLFCASLGIWHLDLKTNGFEVLIHKILNLMVSDLQKAIFCYSQHLRNQDLSEKTSKLGQDCGQDKSVNITNFTKIPHFPLFQQGECVIYMIFI